MNHEREKSKFSIDQTIKKVTKIFEVDFEVSTPRLLEEGSTPRGTSQFGQRLYIPFWLQVLVNIDKTKFT